MYTQQKVFVIQVMLNVCSQQQDGTHPHLADSQHNLYDKYLSPCILH
jgi:hypothetical protein